MPAIDSAARRNASVAPERGWRFDPAGASTLRVPRPDRLPPALNAALQAVLPRRPSLGRLCAGPWHQEAGAPPPIVAALLAAAHRSDENRDDRRSDGASSEAD